MRWIPVSIVVVTCLACSGLEMPTVVSEPVEAPAVIPAPVVDPAPAADPVPTAAPSGKGATASATDPVETVRSVYAQYDASPDATEPRWLPVATAELARTWDVARTEAVDACGVAAIDQGDVMVDAQDIRISKLTVTAKVEGESARATARFQNFDEPREVRLDLVREGGLWRIDDVHPTGDSLKQRILQTVVAGDGC